MCILLDPCSFWIPPITLGTPIISPVWFINNHTLQLNVFFKLCNVSSLVIIVVLLSIFWQLFQLRRTIILFLLGLRIVLIPKEAALVLHAEVVVLGAASLYPSVSSYGEKRATSEKHTTTTNIHIVSIAFRPEQRQIPKPKTRQRDAFF